MKALFNKIIGVLRYYSTYIVSEYKFYQDNRWDASLRTVVSSSWRPLE